MLNTLAKSNLLLGGKTPCGVTIHISCPFFVMGVTVRFSFFIRAMYRIVGDTLVEVPGVRVAMMDRRIRRAVVPREAS